MLATKDYSLKPIEVNFIRINAINTKGSLIKINFTLLKQTL